MGYLICDKCEGNYELQPGESPDDFDLTCNCGGKLKVHNSFDDYYDENTIPHRESIVGAKGYAQKMRSEYDSMIILGAILSLIGIVGLIISPLSIIILFIGAGLAVSGYNKGKTWNKGIKGENIVSEYLKQLPDDYFIFNDVKFPGSYGNLDHIVIGTNGIFVIETKNIKGFYIVKGNQWFYNKRKALSQPGKQVISNVVSLKKFLIDKDINMDKVWVNGIVTLLNNNFKIEQKPKYYNILFPSTIPEFILNYNKKSAKMDITILKEVAYLIGPHSKELSYIESSTR
ncbi:nuclease-related domain-containing protein [Methanobacterium sp. SMA-27]|uniref:nuclease-related domain-containing protein n=1 Tax=Methanobacterium sp. SMA-27 TaxID=1495336 RepID=UPI000694C79A|nr:nuclease-related domain-containing protein [Methanobacterium sp. SMA-27]